MARDLQNAHDRTTGELRDCRAEVNRLQATVDAQARMLAQIAEAASDVLDHRNDYPTDLTSGRAYDVAMARLHDIVAEWEMER
jgi:hypothetical protein